MRFGNTQHGRTLRLTLAGCALLIGCMAGAPAYAVTVSAPVNVLRAADVRVSLGSNEATGLGMLLVDGAVSRVASVRPASSVTLPAVSLAPGSHRITATVRSRLGLTCSTAITVTSWNAPEAPRYRLAGDPNWLPERVSFSPSAGASTTKLTVLVNGVVISATNVKGPTVVPVTVDLKRGSNTVELRAENPVSRTSTVFSLVRPVWPLPGYTELSSHFGMRWGRMHEGIDIPAPSGTRIVAAAPGTVVFTGVRGGYGNLTLIDHGGGMVTAYGHQSSIGVSTGAKVVQGQAIGRVGTTGNSTGPHLHFEVRVNGQARDPLDYL